jgi:hypothetical protein
MILASVLKFIQDSPERTSWGEIRRTMQSSRNLAASLPEL